VTALGLAIGGALAIALLSRELTRTLRVQPDGPPPKRLTAAIWLLGTTFLALVVIRLTDYLS
jgi:hypothetical protein